MLSVVENPISLLWEFILSYRSNKSPWDRTDSCEALAQLGDLRDEQLPFCWKEATRVQ